MDQQFDSLLQNENDTVEHSMKKLLPINIVGNPVVKTSNNNKMVGSSLSSYQHEEQVKYQPVPKLSLMNNNVQ